MLPETVREAAQRFGDRAAFVDQRGDELTYAALDDRSDDAARALRAQGIGERSVCALRMGSTFGYVISYVALAKLGAATAGINPSLASVEQDALVERLAPDLVLTSEPTIGNAGVPGDTDAEPLLPLPDDPERLVAVVFTSGTTGPPKGAIFRNRQLAAICEADLGRGWDERWGGGGAMLASTQFAHVGFMTKLPWYLRLGVTMHVLDRWRAADVLHTVATHRFDTLGVVLHSSRSCCGAPRPPTSTCRASTASSPAARRHPRPS